MKTLKVTLKRRNTNGQQSTLEHALIADYLLAKGYLMSELKDLPVDEARQLMTEACRFAGLRLAEIEARARFRRNIQLPD
jgi:hypothetical protein